MAQARPAGPEPKPAAAKAPEFDFPNCDPVPMTWPQLLRHDGRIEYWDARFNTAWVLRDGATFTHEAPCSVLAELLSRLSQERGARVRCYGHAFLMVRDLRGRPSRIMCADQTIYLNPKPFRSATDSDAVVIGSDPLPDVVLEVDHTTDVRRAKLGLYAAWGFPEVWVETPDKPARSRPGNVRPGLTVYRLEGGAYEEAEASVAFPLWKAPLIHRALNEERISEGTLRELVRLGRLLGRQAGTGPDDDPQLSAHRRWAHRQGVAQGREGGLQDGRKEGRQDGLREGRQAGFESGRRQGLAEQRALLASMVERKFDAAAAQLFAERLGEVDQPERLVQAAGWIIECDELSELLILLDDF